MDLQQQEQFFQFMNRVKANSKRPSSQSQNQAPVITPPCRMIVSDNPDRITTSKEHLLHLSMRQL